MVYELRFTIEHDGDWTMLTDEFDIKMRTISYFTRHIGNKYENVEVFNINCNVQSDFSIDNLYSFVQHIKRYRNVFKVSVLNLRKDYAHPTMDVLTVEDYNMSIRKLINDNLGFFISTISQKNIEEYVVLFPLGKMSLFSELRQQLSNVGRIKYFNLAKMSEPTLPTVTHLTRREMDSIQLAWQRGFFDYPKSVKLDEMAKSLNITKSTLNFHIRRALKKSIKFLLENALLDVI